jgi:ApaG protein
MTDGKMGRGGGQQMRLVWARRSWQCACVSQATTRGIRIIVESVYLADRSSPRSQQFAFAYMVRIINEGQKPAQLRTRHWIITDGHGKVQEVKGDGVVGKQPLLGPGEDFEYTSGCVLETPHGTMHGTYQMVRPDGEAFDAEIAPFLLAMPNSLN